MKKDYYDTKGATWATKFYYGVHWETLELIKRKGIGEYAFEGSSTFITPSYGSFQFNSKHYKFFRTKKEAVDFQIKELDRLIQNARNNIENWEKQKAVLAYK